VELNRLFSSNVAPALDVLDAGLHEDSDNDLINQPRRNGQRAGVVPNRADQVPEDESMDLEYDDEDFKEDNSDNGLRDDEEEGEDESMNDRYDNQ
jgi:hypothetical protein